MQTTELPAKADSTIAKSIAKYCLRRQKIWAEWMQRKTEQLSVKSKLILLVLFMILTSASNICLLVICFTNAKPLSFSVTPIESPVNIGKANDKAEASLLSADREFRRMQAVKRQMDTLSKTVSGREFY